MSIIRRPGGTTAPPPTTGGTTTGTTTGNAVKDAAQDALLTANTAKDAAQDTLLTAVLADVAVLKTTVAGLVSSAAGSVVAAISKVFNYATTGSAFSSTQPGFKPDLLLIKSRNTTKLAAVTDSARGNNKLQNIQNGYAEETIGITLDDTGLTLAANTILNAANGSWEALALKKGSTFDVVAYTGDGDANRTIAHSLGSIPDAMWIMQRNGNPSNYAFFREIATSSPESKVLELGSNEAMYTWADPFKAMPTAQVFSAGATGGGGTNQIGGNYIAYLFKSIAEKCKIGKFTGNNTSQSIALDFAPSMVILRAIAGGDWLVWNKESSANPNTKSMTLNTYSAEGNISIPMSLSTNSFEVTVNGDFMYMAFA